MYVCPSIHTYEHLRRLWQQVNSTQLIFTNNHGNILSSKPVGFLSTIILSISLNTI